MMVTEVYTNFLTLPCIICILITFAKSAYRLGRFVKNQGEEVKQEDGGEESLLVMELAIAGEAIMMLLLILTVIKEVGELINRG